MPSVLRFLFMARIPRCLSWQHFRSAVGRKGVTLLTGSIHRGPLLLGEELNKRGDPWLFRRECEVVFNGGVRHPWGALLSGRGKQRLKRLNLLPDPVGFVSLLV